MDIITGKILKLNNWPDGKIIGIAKSISEQLSAQGLSREAVLSQLDAVRQDPGPFLADPLLADLARECIRLTQKAEPSPDIHTLEAQSFPIWGGSKLTMKQSSKWTAPCGFAC
ncbi:hypothetical protein [Candidatus Villigracilis saccharophilus]|uniref:hypothetical protein n=1 Tax=Candidatus Villigracilis saccharophilus TaxID=3140684 RepID=UPI003134D053|nr:hypothetical protein [Anaerolineales bacterium]